MRRIKNRILAGIAITLVALILITVGQIWNEAATLGYLLSRASIVPAAPALAQAPTAAAPAETALTNITIAPSTPPSPAASVTRPAAPGQPIRAAFYYGWFPEAWNQKGIQPFTNYHPTLGYYNSSDPAIVREQIAAMQYGHIDVGIASWWGPNTPTDQRMPILLKAAEGTNFQWTIYYEAEGQGNPSPSQITSDLTYIRDHYAGDPSYFKIDGRFVVFVYGDPTDNCDMSSRWSQGNTVNAYVVLKVFPNYRQCPSQPDSWHQYAPAVAESHQSGFSYSISPGFWLAGQKERLPRDLARWYASVRNMVASNASFQLITTFNEWGEGTAVESAQDWATASGYGAYLDALHTNGEGGPPGVGASAQATAGAAAPSGQTTSPPAQAAPTLTETPAPSAFPLPSLVPPKLSLPLPNLLPGQDPVLAGAGDIACDPSDPNYNNGNGGKNNCHEKATSDLLLSLKESGNLTAVFNLGDNQYENGAGAKYGTSYDQTWGRLKDITYPAVGNHEYLTPGATPYFQYFASTAGVSQKGYYSYDLGTWHIVVVNSNCSRVGGCSTGSPQEQWLRSDLAANAGKCTLAYWHHPLFSSGGHGADAAMQPIWQDLYDYGTALVLNGHDHDYERFAPQDPNGAADPNGIREFVVGTGGKNHTHLKQLQPNSEVFNDNTFGVLKLTLHPKGYDWQFLPEPGKTFTDTGSGVCAARKG